MKHETLVLGNVFQENKMKLPLDFFGAGIKVFAKKYYLHFSVRSGSGCGYRSKTQDPNIFLPSFQPSGILADETSKG